MVQFRRCLVFPPVHLADGAPRTEPGSGRASVPACHTPGRPAAISMDAIGAASVTPVDAIESPFPVIRIHANALMSVLPIRIPSANTIRSRHVDPGGVQEGSRGLSEATPPEHAPRTRANPGWGSRTRASTGRHRVSGSLVSRCKWGWVRERAALSRVRTAPAVVIDRGRYRGWGLDPIQADLEPLPGFSAVLGGAIRGCRCAQPPATVLSPSGAVVRETGGRPNL